MTAVEFILQHCNNNTDVNSVESSYYTYTPLIYASTYGHSEVVGLLLQHPQIDVNKKGNMDESTALHVASQNGHSPVVELLLQHPQIDVNKGRNDGQTALHVASTLGRSEVVQLLLRRRPTSQCYSNNPVSAHTICEIDIRRSDEKASVSLSYPHKLRATPRLWHPYSPCGNQFRTYHWSWR